MIDRRVRPHAWLAFVALLALALAPTVSRLLDGPRAPAELAAVCGPGGLRAADAGAPDGAGGAVVTLAHLESCAYCGLAFAALAPPPTVPGWPAARVARASMAIDAEPSPTRVTGWAPALPRAPPSRG